MPRSPSSLHTASSPSSSSRGRPLAAARKRTLPAPAADPVPVTPQEQTFGRAASRGETWSSPASSTSRSYRYQSPRARDQGAAGSSSDVGILLSSPASIYSSPEMTRSMSAHSIFGPPLHHQQQQLYPQVGFGSSPLARTVSLDLVGPNRAKRGSVKRRRTVIGGPPTSPELSPRLSLPSFKRWYGREGENVWPPEVDEAFFRALHLLPRLGRKKLLIDGKARGRNELISNYIYRTTGQERSRKQVSSHIQVLKNMYRNDAEFMELVSEPELGSDRFIGDNARLFFGDDSEYGKPGRHLTAPSPPSIDVDAAKSFSSHMQRSESSPALHSPFTLHPGHGAATPTTELSYVFQDMSVLASPTPAQPAAGFVLGEIEMTVRSENISVNDDDDDDDTSLPRVLCRGRQPASATLRGVAIEELPTGKVRYATLLESMKDQRCQHLYAKLYLDMPLEASGTDPPSCVDVRICLRAAQALSLTVVTTIYCHGEQVIRLAEPLATPFRSSVTGATSLPPSSPSSDQQEHQHQYSYSVPFAATYWSHFLSSGTERRIGCSGDERDELAQNLGMFSVVQEFAFTPNATAGAFPPINEDSEMGAAYDGDLGDVVLVVAYDLELSDDNDIRKGTVEISRLETPPHRPETPFFLSPAASSTPLAATSMSRSVTLPVLSSTNEMWASTTTTTTSDMAPPTVLSRSTSSSRSYAPYHKPNLSLHIPPASQFLRPPLLPNHVSTAGAHGPIQKGSAPSTPWDQLVHTPQAPPPVLHDPFAEAQQSRLENIWLQTATSEWDLHSPAMLGVSQSPFEEGGLAAYGGQFDPVAPQSMYTSVPMQPSFSLPTYATYHDAGLPPASEALRAFLSPATADEHVPTSLRCADSPSPASISVPASEELIDVPTASTAATAPANVVPAMSISSSSTGLNASTAPTEGEAATAPTSRAAVQPPAAAVSEGTLGQDSPQKLKVKLEQDFFSELLGAKTKYAQRLSCSQGILD
ncbi:hypothetical protein JCM3774_000940 [Rhodotorula dairenensis]